MSDELLSVGEALKVMGEDGVTVGVEGVRATTEGDGWIEESLRKE